MTRPGPRSKPEEIARIRLSNGLEVSATPQGAVIPPSSMTKDQLMQMLVNAPPVQAKQILGERL